MHQSQVDGLWQGGQSSAGEIKLHALQPMTSRGSECLFEIRPGKRLGKNPQLHQTPPVISDNLTFSPDSADLAIATIALIAATPSSMRAPHCGRPWRIASAKLSICN